MKERIYHRLYIIRKVASFLTTGKNLLKSECGSACQWYGDFTMINNSILHGISVSVRISSITVCETKNCELMVAVILEVPGKALLLRLQIQIEA